MSSGNDNYLQGILNSTSRYINLDMVSYDSKAMINAFDPPLIRSLQDNVDTTMVVNGIYIDRLDLVSLRYYSSPKYWWVLALYNGLDNPFSLPYGTIIYIPTYASLAQSNIIRS